MDIYAILTECTGFNWDVGNAEKNWHKHKVSMQEAEEAFFNDPLIVAEDEKHSKSEQRFYALGKTDNKRKLFLVFTIRKKKIRIISARNMSVKERRIYHAQEENTYIQH